MSDDGTVKDAIMEIAERLGSLKATVNDLNERMRAIYDAFEKHCYTPDAHHPAIVAKKREEA